MRFGASLSSRRTSRWPRWRVNLDSVVGDGYAQAVASAIKRLTDEQLVELLELAKKADSVELKLTIPAADHRAAITGLGLDPLEAQIRQVFFFDTPDLDLNAVGVVARARRIQGRPGDTVVKLRPVDPDGLPDELRLSPNIVVEVDAMPDGYVCSASLKAKAGARSVREAAVGELSDSEALLEGAANILLGACARAGSR